MQVQSSGDVVVSEPEPRGGPTVLVVDDPAKASQLYGEYLEFCGFRVITAADPAAAARLLAAEQPDVVLVDVGRLPAPAAETIRQLKTAYVGAPVPVVALGSLGETARVAREAGADVLLAKPCVPSQIARAIAVLLVSRGSSLR